MKNNVLDLSKYDKTNHSLLKKRDERVTEKPRVVEKVVVKKETAKVVQSKKATEKLGRPMMADEPLDQKCSFNITLTEMEKFKTKIGQVPMAAWLRNFLKEEKAA